MIKYLEEGCYITVPIEVDMDSKGRGRNELPIYFNIYSFNSDICLCNSQVNFIEDTIRIEEVLERQEPSPMNYVIDGDKVILSLRDNVLNAKPYKLSICNDIKKIETFKEEHIYFIPKYCDKGLKNIYDIKNLIEKMHSNFEENVPLRKNQINSIQIDVTSNDQSALSILLHKDGTINRQGNGDLPAVKVAAIGKTNGDEYKKLLEIIPENDALLDHSLEYNHPDLQGDKVCYNIIFLGDRPLLRKYLLSFGQQNSDVHQIVKFFDHFINQAKTLTDAFYEKALDKKISQKKPWWNF